MLKKINILIIAIFFYGIFFRGINIHSQNEHTHNAFDSYLEKDSIYRFNTSLRKLDSLINGSIVKSRDTAFYNSYGKADGITLSQLIYFALSNNPELISMQYKVDAEVARSNEFTSLPDPMFEFELYDITTDFKRISDYDFFLSQTFPYPGKLDLSRKSALNTSQIYMEEHHETEVKMINMVKNNFYDLYILNQKLQINKENQLVMKNFVTATESKYSVGKGMQQEVFKAQIELSKLMNEEFVLTQERKNIYSELTTLTKVTINENTRVSFANIDVDYLLNHNSFDTENISENKLLDYALEHRADLKTLQSKITLNRTDLEISKLSRMPDFTLRLGYKIYPYMDRNTFDVMVGINIPFAPWSSGKYDAAIQKSEIDIKMTTSDYEAKKNEIKNEVQKAFNTLQSGRETMRYYYTVLIPQSENSLRASQNAYESDLTAFLDVLDAYRMYQQAKLMFYDSMKIYLMTITELEKAAGLNLKN